MNKMAVMQLQAGWPHDLSYDKSNSKADDFYSSIKGAITEPSSIFYGKRQIDIFLLAMAVGYEEKRRKKVSRHSRSIRRDALSEREVWMMCSVALAEEKTLDLLANPSHVIQICEEYANGGIDTLIRMDEYGGNGLDQYEESVEQLAVSTYNHNRSI